MGLGPSHLLGANRSGCLRENLSPVLAVHESPIVPVPCVADRTFRMQTTRSVPIKNVARVRGGGGASCAWNALSGSTIRRLVLQGLMLDTTTNEYFPHLSTAYSFH